MNGLKEMQRFEKIGDPVERFVVDQDGAQQRLLGLYVLRRVAVLRGRRFRQLADGGIERGHDSRANGPAVTKSVGSALHIGSTQDTTLHIGTRGIVGGDWR